MKLLTLKADLTYVKMEQGAAGAAGVSSVDHILDGRQAVAPSHPHRQSKQADPAAHPQHHT